jgi:hypothetical protein
MQRKLLMQQQTSTSSEHFIYVWHLYVSPKTYKCFGTFIIKDIVYISFILRRVKTVGTELDTFWITG